MLMISQECLRCESHVPGPGWLRGSPVRGASYIVPDTFRESEKPHKYFFLTIFFFFLIRPFLGPLDSNLNIAIVTISVFTRLDLIFPSSQKHLQLRIVSGHASYRAFDQHTSPGYNELDNQRELSARLKGFAFSHAVDLSNMYYALNYH